MRFPEFNEKYSKCKIIDVANVIGGGTPETLNENFWNGGINWFTPTEVGHIKYVTNSNRTISKEGLYNSSAKILPIGSILFSSRATIGEMSINLIETATNQGFQSLIINSRNSNEYFYYLLHTLKRQFIKQACGSTFPEISNSEVSKTEIRIPKIQEQQKIADFLSLIDKRIDTQTKIIEDLEYQIKWIKVKFFNSYINCNSYQFNNLFFEYKKLNNLAYKQYTIGKYGIKELNYDSNLYTTNKHIIFEPNTLILGIGIEEIGVSDELFGCCSPIYKTFCINNQIINTCWFYYFASMYFDKIKRFVTQKSTRREFEFDYKALNIIKFSIPTLDIQKIHCNLLNFISTKIQKEKDILELYKKQKAYLLKNMFI